jgi:hypothetical protein
VEPHEEYVRVGYHGEREFQAAGNLPRQGSAGGGYGGYSGSGGYEVSGGYGGYGADGGSFSGQNRHRRGPPIYDIGLQDYTQGEEASDGKRTGRYSAAAHQKPGGSGNNNLYNNVPGRAAVGATPRPGYKKQQFYEQSDPGQDYAIRGPQAYYDPGPLGEEVGAVGGEEGGHGHPDEYGSHHAGGSSNFEEYERLVEEGHKSSIHGGGEGDGGGEFDHHGLDAEDVHGVEVAAAAAVEQQIENDPRYNNDGFEHGDNDDDRHLDDSSSSSGSGGGGDGEENRHQNEDLFDPANFPFQGYGGNHGGGGGEGQDDDGFGHRPSNGDHEGASGGGGGHFGSQGYQSEDAPSYGSKPSLGEFGGGKPLYEEGGFHPSAQPPSGSYPRQESPPPPRYQEPQQGGQQNPPDADYERYFTLHYDYDYEPANNNNNNGNEHNSSPPASSSQEERGDDRQHGGVDEHGFEDIFADKRSVRGQGSRGFGHF